VADISLTVPEHGFAVDRGDGVEPPVKNLLAALVLGEAVSARSLSGLDADRLRAEAEQEGVLPLVAERLRQLGSAPAALVTTMAGRATREAAADLIREAELRRLVPALAASGAVALIMKGAQLAYSHYPRPDLRPRMDTDILVTPGARPLAHRCLVELGYGPVDQVAGDLVMYQALYVKHRAGTAVHAVDLHWRLANPQRFGGVLTHAELAADAVPIAGLGEQARGLSNPHALLVACVHPIAHHPHAQRLIWHYDIHLIASRLTADEWESFTSLAIDRRVNTVCRRSLELASHYFGTAVPSRTGTRLNRTASVDAETAAYLSPGRRQIHDAMWDFRALPSWADRCRLVCQHLFPSAHYMRDVYAPSSGAPLPVLYARRALRGARRWLART
jgi:hypothetical protein